MVSIFEFETKPNAFVLTDLPRCNPNIVTELLGYQKMISEYATQFKPQVWLALMREHIDRYVL